MRPADDLQPSVIGGGVAAVLWIRPVKTVYSRVSTGALCSSAVVQRGQSAPFWCTAVLCALSRATEK